MSSRQPLPLVHGTSVLLRGAYRLLGGLRVRGVEHLPKTGAAIVASNHLSWADPPALRSVIRRRCWFMGNHDLFDLPAVGKLLPLFGGFPVVRSDDPGRADRSALKVAEQHLKDGDLLCVFPEGGTTVTGTLHPFEGGVALLALRNNVPIVPVAITGTDRMWPPEASRPRYARGGVSLTFGPPIHPSDIPAGLPRRERMERLTVRLYDAIAAMLPPEYVPAEYVAGTMPERAHASP
jgi:1-acyl-sn-glycerol-3-phosphate acyltransferase